MNAGFVCIKVDREERPDLDAVYMNATVALTGQGGWPMTCFLTADGRALLLRHLLSTRPRHGQPGFGELLDRDHARPGRTPRRGRAGSEQIAGAAAPGGCRIARRDGPPSTPALRQRCGRRIARRRGSRARRVRAAPRSFRRRRCSRRCCATTNGSGSPAAVDVVERAAQAMARGGIYDQLAGGFARYSVDDAWVVPHFEKMLYDNALLLRVYAHWARRDSQAPGRDGSPTRPSRFSIEALGTPVAGSPRRWTPTPTGVEGATYVWTPGAAARRAR